MAAVAMIYGLGPRGRRVYEAIRERIARGDLAPGAQLPSHRELAVNFGVAPMTIRQVLGTLEADGMVLRQPGRGTFVQAPDGPTVLIVDGDVDVRTILTAYIGEVGLGAVAASGPAEGLAALIADPTIGLVVGSIRLPAVTDGADFIRTVRRRWPELPLAALSTYSDDLNELHGTEAWPVLIMSKPVRLSQLREVLRLALGSRATRFRQAGT